MPVYRLVAKWNDDPNHVGGIITLDVPLDSSGKVREQVFFGAIGRLSDRTAFRSPFVVQLDGRLGYYHDQDNPDISDDRINLIGRVLTVGEQFTQFEGDYESIYTITSMTEL